MGLFDRIKRAPSMPGSLPPPPAALTPNLHQVNVVGESFHQDAFVAICGPKCADGVNLDCEAMLVANPENPYDANAVEVRIDGHLVGHLSRDIAPVVSPRLQAREQPLMVTAHIVGGWDRGGGDQGHFGVVVWMPPPETI